MLDLSNLKKSFAETYARLFKPLTLFIFVSCWIMGTLAGPFGTFQAMSFGVRALYWFGIVSMAIVMGFGVRAVIVVVMNPARPLLSDVAAAALMSVVFVPYGYLLRSFFSRLSEGLEVGLLSMMFNTFLLALAIFVVRRQLVVNEPGRYLVLDEGDETEEDAAPRLLRRLPAEVQGDVLRLSANDHHVEVVTSQGREVLRLRLADAISEMEPVDGIATHRSHWVALTAIRGVEREGGQKVFLMLSNGDRVPVSRSYRSELEARGYLAAPCAKAG